MGAVRSSVLKTAGTSDNLAQGPRKPTKGGPLVPSQIPTSLGGLPLLSEDIRMKVEFWLVN